MTDAQAHRGPDASGIWSDGVCTLGHRRLAIIDLSPAGRQPLSNEDGSVWITFNGEVYNFQELRQQLEARGHQFRTRTDTEAIVHAYEEWGTDCVRRLRGMFAFAIWDQNARRLFLARDRAGKKPIVYTVRGDRFLFASELQGLLADPDVPRDVDAAAVNEYLSFGYVPAPRSGFLGISKLLPGHWMTVDYTGDGPRLESGRYWSLEYGDKLELSEEEAARLLREKLAEAVRIRMISDVPLGAFLSGGIDSTIVVGLMAEASSRPVKTFSIGFSEAEFNELPHARRVAERWKTEHHEHVVTPDVAGLIPLLARHYGEPYADSSAVPTYYVSRMTRENVTVALNGDGGDESFAGYERYRAFRAAERLARYPGAAAGAGVMARLLPPATHPKSRITRLRRFLTAAGEPKAARYARWVGGSLGALSEAEKERLCTPEFRRATAAARPVRWMEELFQGTEALDPVDAAMSVDVRSYLAYDLLVKVDITSMANSLEARSPLLDQEVMELAARLPVSMKLAGGQAKRLLKLAFADLLPPENVNRRKMGFGVPLGAWFRQGPVREAFQDVVLAGGASSAYVSADGAATLLREHQSGRADHGYALWNLLMLEYWHREVVARRPAAAVPAGGA